MIKVKLLEHTPNPERVVAMAARLCYSPIGAEELSEKLSDEQVKKMVEKMVALGHASTIEHVSFTFGIEGVSRVLTHQLVRHRIASYSQQSQRYVDGSNFDYILPPAIGTNLGARQRFEACMQEIGATYREIRQLLIAAGRSETQASEDARFVLPQAAETRIVISMNCRSLLHFFAERCCTRAQWEIRALAFEMLKLAKEAVPVVFRTAGAKCEALGYCPEGERFTCGRYPLRQDTAK